MNKQRFTWLVVAVVSALALVGCSGPSSGKKSNASSTVNLFMYQKPVGLFGPLTPSSGPDQEVISLIYDTLLQVDPKGVFQPQAATALPTVSADAKTITYKLKPNLKWSDGQPLTSDDLLFTYTRAADVNTGSGWATYFTGVKGLEDYTSGKATTISGFSAPTPDTFVITLDSPNSTFYQQVSAVGLLPKHILGTLPAKDLESNAWFRKPTVTSGAFTFVKYATDQYVQLKKNSNFREPVGVQNVYLKPVAAAVATQQLSTGEMDIAWITAPDAKTVAGFSGVNVVSVAAPGFVRAAWNQSEARFKDPRVKQAFLYAVDRKGLVQSALDGHGAVANDILGAKWTGSDLNQYPYDPEKAKQLLRAANWDSSKPVKLSWVPGTNPDRDAAATVLEQQLNKVGVKLQLNQVQTTWFTGAYKTHSFDMVLYGGGDYTSTPSNIGPVTGCANFIPAGANVGLYCNKQLDSLFKQAVAQTDPAAQAATWKQAAKVENADPSMMWLYSLDNLFGVSKKVQNFQPLTNANWYQPWKWTVSD